MISVRAGRSSPQAVSKGNRKVAWRSFSSEIRRIRYRRGDCGLSRTLDGRIGRCPRCLTLAGCLKKLDYGRLKMLWIGARQGVAVVILSGMSLDIDFSAPSTMMNPTGAFRGGRDSGSGLAGASKL